MKRNYRYIMIWMVFIFLLLWGNEAWSQCAMCRTTAETATAEKDSQAQAINDGIIYIMIIPYILLGSIVFLWWKFRKRKPLPSENG